MMIIRSGASQFLQLRNTITHFYLMNITNWGIVLVIGADRPFH